MVDRTMQIGLVGTFDVENYGDLLFPLIAEAELTERLGAVKLHRFSYHAKSTPGWPFTVTSVTELPRMIGELDGLLIGGGFIIRFDKFVAAGYGPPTLAIHHPTGYWLTPALMALQQGVPVIWNGPGMHCNEIPDWAEPLLRLALEHSSYVAVRDEPSRADLECFSGNQPITVIPDTAFGISGLLDGCVPSAELNSLREASGLNGPYILVQPARELDSFLSFVKKHSHLLREFRFLALPIGPVLGDDAAILEDDLPRFVRLPVWPHPLLLAELIGHASAVVGHSYHLAITALAFGVPVFTSADLTVGKFTAFSGLTTMYPLPDETKAGPDWFVSRLERTTPTPATRAALDQLAQHWDRVAEVIKKGRTGKQSAIAEFLQSLPNLLETAADRRDGAVRSLAVARAELAASNDRIARLINSRSWKVTAPARFLMRNVKRLLGSQPR